METAETRTNQENWVDLIPHRKDVLLEDVEIFKDYLVLSERSIGLNKIKVIPWNAPETAYYLDFESETLHYIQRLNLDFDTNTLRYFYNSLTTPASTIDFNMLTKHREVKKEQEVLGGDFDKIITHQSAYGQKLKME